MAALFRIAEIELYERAVVLRLPGGARTLARVPAEDGATLAVLMDTAQSPVGRVGTVGAGAGGLLYWAA